MPQRLRPRVPVMRTVLAVIAAVILVVGAIVAGGVGTFATSDEAPTTVAAARVTGLPVVAAADLPAEARQTLRSIDRGGPFPYARDGSVFGNREGLLPARSRGYYREYTVPTPGARDRGARRIVTGDDDTEFFYTSDHYGSFRVIER